MDREAVGHHSDASGRHSTLASEGQGLGQLTTVHSRSKPFRDGIPLSLQSAHVHMLQSSVGHSVFPSAGQRIVP